MMSSLLFALGEHGAAYEDLTQIVANGGVLSTGTTFAILAWQNCIPFCLCL